MNTLAPSLSIADPAVGGACFHCGEAIADGKSGDFCCTGCEAAARFIRESGLDDYYRLRTEAGARPSVEADFSVFDHADVLAEHVESRAGERRIELCLQGMHCAACAWLIGEALRRQTGVVDASANAVTARVRIRWSPEETQLSTLVGVLERLGYHASLAGARDEQQRRQAERRQTLLRLGIAGLGAMQAMMFSEALYLDANQEMSLPTRDFFRWLTFLVATPVVVYGGWPFWFGAWREWTQRRFGMDTLAAFGIGSAWLASSVETIRGGPQVWFDAAVMFVFFLLAARSLEGLAKTRARAHIDRLASAKPALALRKLGDHYETVACHRLQIGDTVLVAAGSAAPADGVLLSAAANFDESLLSGEVRPVHKRAGDTVLAGALALSSQAEIRVGAIGAATRLSEIERAIVKAAECKPATQEGLDRLVRQFVLIVLAASLATAVIWSQLEPARALPLAIAVLMVSCPCALALAIPTALLTAQSRLAKAGLVCLDTEALRQLQGVDTVVFDKTGTLTEGQASILQVECLGALDESRCRSIAAALEHEVRHPLARAFQIADVRPAEQVQVQAGAGVSGRVDGRVYRLGSAAFVGATGVDAGGVYLADEHALLARFVIDDALRADALPLVRELGARGFDLRLLSGDHDQAVGEVAQQLGITQYLARQSPESKLAQLNALRARGHRVAMLGDGINDAPVLAAADVGFSLAQAAPLAHHASDLIALNGKLSAFAFALDLSRALRRIERQNLAWALGYNLVMLPLAMSGQIGPGLAALGMSLSSLTVTVNALRLLRLKDHRPGHE